MPGVTALVATLAWTCDQTETFMVGEDVQLPGWSAADLIGGFWTAQARSPVDNPLAALTFDSRDGSTIVQGAVTDGAGTDSSGVTIPGATVSLTFRQPDAAVRLAVAQSYPISVKFTAADGTKTIVAAGTLYIVQGPTW